MMNDPVCGMPVDPAKSPYRREYQGHTYHFCSTNCQQKFDAEPDRYLAQATAAIAVFVTDEFGKDYLEVKVFKSKSKNAFKVIPESVFVELKLELKTVHHLCLCFFKALRRFIICVS